LTPGERRADLLEGIVLRRSSHVAWVDTPRGVLVSTIRGKLREAEPCVAGDRVLVLPTGGQEGAVEEVLPRGTVLRRGPLTGEAGGKVTAANIDQVAVVISVASPGPRWALVDRLLVEDESEGLESLVIVNKLDLLDRESGEKEGLEDTFRVYRSAGVELFLTSTVSGEGLDGLGRKLLTRVTVFSGHSGVGKTALLNALVPGLDLRTGEVNPVTGKGRHTSSTAILVRLPGGGYLMDTPGFREFALSGISPPQLGRYYPEFREAIASCRYRDCLHRTGPGCAVLEAVEQGEISKLRYRNYLQILETLPLTETRKRRQRRARKESPEPS